MQTQASPEDAIANPARQRDRRNHLGGQLLANWSNSCHRKSSCHRKDAALSGLDQGEFVTIPALPECRTVAGLRVRTAVTAPQFVSEGASSEVRNRPCRRNRTKC